MFSSFTGPKNPWGVKEEAEREPERERKEEKEEENKTDKKNDGARLPSWSIWLLSVLFVYGTYRFLNRPRHYGRVR